MVLVHQVQVSSGGWTTFQIFIHYFKEMLTEIKSQTLYMVDFYTIMVWRMDVVLDLQQMVLLIPISMSVEVKLIQSILIMILELIF